MDANSIQAGSNQVSGSRFHDNFNISNDTWEVLNMPLDDTPQLSFTLLIPCIDFNFFPYVSSTVPHIPISSPVVSITSTTLKFGA